MIINVGSENPVKIKAVKEAFNSYPDHFNNVMVKSCSIENLEKVVSKQPISYEEIIKGAMIRAEGSYLSAPCDYGVGIEAGTYPIPLLPYHLDVCMCIIYGEQGIVGIGQSPGFRYPNSMVDRLLNNRDLEVGTLMDELQKKKNTKQKDGAVGYFTKGVVPRKDFVKSAVIMALISLINKDLFKD